MAEVPGAHGKRVQALLAWLVTCQGGSALPFLLPGLLLCSQPNADSLEAAEPGTHKHWQQSLLQPQARPLDAWPGTPLLISIYKFEVIIS